MPLSQITPTPGSRMKKSCLPTKGDSKPRGPCVCRAEQQLLSSWVSMAEGVECQTNSRQAGWHLMEPGGSRGQRPDTGSRRGKGCLKFKDDLGRALDADFLLPAHLCGMAGQGVGGNAETILLTHTAPERIPALSVLGVEG